MINGKVVVQYLNERYSDGALYLVDQELWNKIKSIRSGRCSDWPDDVNELLKKAFADENKIKSDGVVSSIADNFGCWEPEPPSGAKDFRWGLFG